MRSYWEARRKISSPIEPHPPGIPCPPGLRQVLSPVPKTPVAARLNSFVRDAVMLSRSKSTIPYFQRRIAIAVLFTTRYSSNPDPRSWGQIAKEISELLGIPKNSRSGVIANIKTAKLGGDLSQFNVKAGTSQRRKGRFLIKDGSPEASILIRGLESGMLKNGALTWVNYYIFTREDWATSSIQICSYYVHCPLPEQTSDAPPARKNKKWFDSRRRIGHRPAYVSWNSFSALFRTAIGD